MEAPEAVSETPVVEASQPVAEEEAEEEAPTEAEDVCDSLHPFTFKKINYLRFGHEEDGEKIWDEGNDLWLAKPDGSKGAYAGILLATGKIDNRPEILAAEPDIQ
jgi:hypothetical protein